MRAVQPPVHHLRDDRGDPADRHQKGGSREEFSRDKILRGLIRACEKRPVPVERLEVIVSEVEKSLRGIALAEIESRQIGELVMEQLYPVDEVAYVRFASVYRQFKDINMFMKELKGLLSKNTEELDGL